MCIILAYNIKIYEYFIGYFTAYMYSIQGVSFIRGIL